ncbi:MAG: hypothetical protein ABIK51_02085 [candidate division WOR-3 bacterium]
MKLKLTLLLLLLAVCSPPQNPFPELTPPGWIDGETSVFSVRRNDSLVFRRTITVELDEEAGEPVLVFRSVVESESAPFFFLDSTIFTLTRYTLKPCWLYRVVASEISISEVEVTFDADAITLQKNTIDGTSKLTLKPVPYSYCMEMLPMLLRAVPLDPGLKFTLSGIIPLEMRTQPVQVKILGTRLVATPLGEILCREIETATRGRTVRLLYELADPHRLVAIRDEENSTETVLSQFFIREPQTTLPEE